MYQISIKCRKKEFYTQIPMKGTFKIRSFEFFVLKKKEKEGKIRFLIKKI